MKGFLGGTVRSNAGVAVKDPRWPSRSNTDRLIATSTRRTAEYCCELFVNQWHFGGSLGRGGEIANVTQAV